MCNSPVPVYVLGRHMLDAYFFEMEGTADLDFVICDVAKNSTSDRERIVDYSWLEFAKKPCFSPADSISSRVRALVRWIERSYTEKCTRELPEALRAHSKTMGFEYDVYLSSIVSHDGRRVEGVVQAVDSCVYITLAIPLLLEERARVQRNLSNVVELYSKVLQLRLDTVPQFSRVEISLIISCCANSRDAPVDVLSERISMDLGEPKNSTEVSFISFITSCVKFRRMPRYSSTLQRGASFMDYIPLLERALFVSLREPLHFLELVCIMSSVFGRPISVNVATNYPGECGNGGDVSVRCATFCVVDDATQFGFCICVRYHNGWTLPSVCIIANQYTDGKSQGSPLQGKLQYSEDVRQLEKRCSNEEFLDVVALCEAIERGSFEVMAFLIAVCRGYKQMNDGVENAGPSTNTGAELSIKTIMEQQRVIDTLREMITAMKSRLSTLEAAASNEVAHPSATATGNCDRDASLHQKENLRLNRLVEELTSERDAATAKCAELEVAVERGDCRMAEALKCCRQLKQMEGELRTTRCLLNFTESRYRETELDCRRLKEEMEALSFERSRWKALAMNITNRLDTVTRERALMHISSLEREQSMRTAERRAVSPNSNPNTAAAAIASDNVTSLPTLDAMKLISAWGTQQTAPLPPLPRGVAKDGTRHSSPALPSRSITPRRKGGRYLVPL